jgi:hypothetical protein
MSEEFEDRENDALGELPSSIGKERGDYIQPSAPYASPKSQILNPGTGPIPPDIVKQYQDKATESAVLGSPIIPASVTSVYDARPINARDWLKVSHPSNTMPAGDPAFSYVSTYTVPQGYISVLRKFFWINEIPVFMSYGDIAGGGAEPYLDTLPKLTLSIDGVIVPDYENLQYGINGMSQADDVFALALPGQVIKMEVTIDNEYTQLWTTTGDIPFRLEMYGQNLLIRGLPLPFEISSQLFSGSHKG